jgi:hypothetical protein
MKKSKKKNLAFAMTIKEEVSKQVLFQEYLEEKLILRQLFSIAFP